MHTQSFLIHLHDTRDVQRDVFWQSLPSKAWKQSVVSSFVLWYWMVRSNFDLSCDRKFALQLLALAARLFFYYLEIESRQRVHSRHPSDSYSECNCVDLLQEATSTWSYLEQTTSSSTSKRISRCFIHAQNEKHLRPLKTTETSILLMLVTSIIL